MRKSIIFAAIAAMASLASCQKNNAVVEPQSEELVFTATIENAGTKTTVNTDKDDTDNGGKIYWVKDDEITITDNNSSSAVYVAQSGGSTTTTFKIKSGEIALGEGPYTATYGTAPSTSQSYSDYYSAEKVAKDLYMTAPETETGNFTFTAACSLLKINLTASKDESDNTISEIKVFGKVNSSDVIYTLTCSSAQSISSAKDFFIALPAGSYTVFKFTNSTGHICYKTATSAIEIADNQIQPVTLTGIVFNDMLPGKFTVDSDKQVRFSRGNLYYDNPSGGIASFKFELNQYESQPSSNGDYVTTHVSHFRWAAKSGNLTDDITSAISTDDAYLSGNEDDVFFTNATENTPRSDFEVDGSAGIWRTLSNNEWTHLLSTRTVNDEKGYKWTTLTLSDSKTVSGLIIAPDNYTGSPSLSTDTSWSDWQTMESAGCVFLPAAGYRVETNVSDVGSYGNYWSASPHNEWGTTDNAYCLHFYNGVSSPLSFSTRSYGCSVRLICAAQ